MKKKLKADFRGMDGYYPNEESTCILCVSMNQPRQEGESLLATIALINSKKLKRCIILVSDSLHRINISFIEKCSIVEAQRKALLMGTEWIQRNENIIAKLVVPFEIHRWDDWRANLKYEESFNSINELYKNNNYISSCFELSSTDYIERVLKKNTSDNKFIHLQNAKENSVRYLIEEATIFTLLAAKENINFVLYPGAALPAIKSIHDYLINPTTPHLARWIRYAFKRTKEASFNAIPSTF